jgi:hypothetical protein
MTRVCAPQKASPSHSAPPQLYNRAACAHALTPAPNPTQPILKVVRSPEELESKCPPDRRPLARPHYQFGIRLEPKSRLWGRMGRYGGNNDAYSSISQAGAHGT